MTAIILQTPPADPLNQIITLLEQLRNRLPFAEEELAYHTQLRAMVAEQQEQSAAALAAWRTALARRWECEVQAQRLYTYVRQQVIDAVGTDAPCWQLVEESPADGAWMATDLLNNLRRLAIVVDLIQPALPSHKAIQAELQTMAARLAHAIQETERCEEERRRVQAEQRMLNELCQRSYRRTRQRIVTHLGG